MSTVTRRIQLSPHELEVMAGAKSVQLLVNERPAFSIPQKLLLPLIVQLHGCRVDLEEGPTGWIRRRRLPKVCRSTVAG